MTTLTQNRKARSRYAERRVRLDGICFDSKAEAARYLALKSLEIEGHIFGLEVHRRFDLGDGQSYVADFTYTTIGTSTADDGRVVEDVKNNRNAEYRRKAKLMKERYGITIRETTMDPKSADAILAGYLGQERSTLHEHLQLRPETSGLPSNTQDSRIPKTASVGTRGGKVLGEGFETG